MSSSFHFRRLAGVLGLLTLLVSSVRGMAEAEDELKCAALLAFVQNANWTEQLAANSPLTVGVVGRVAFFRWLRTGAEGKAINGHPIRIVEVKEPADPHCCQVVYLAIDKASEIKPILQAFSAAHVLTIGEYDGFLEEGGAVNLFLLDGHMAFEVSLGTLARSGIEISSRLLRFGQIRNLAKSRPSK